MKIPKYKLTIAYDNVMLTVCFVMKRSMRMHWIEDMEVLLSANQFSEDGKIIYRVGELLGDILTNDEPSVSQDQVPVDFLMSPDDGLKRD